MTKFKEITTVLFDFDGTLIQLNLDFPNLYQEAYSLIERYGIDISPYRGLFLIELEEAITASLQRNNPEKAKRFQKEMREFLRKREIMAAKEAEVVPGACHTLKRLKKKGIKIGIVTRNCKEAVEIGLGKNDFAYDLLLTRDDIRPVKPEPHSLEKALKVLTSKPEETIMIGDHPIDIRAGKKVGVKTVAVLSGKKAEEDFKGFKPDLIIPSVKELLKYL
ncbi:MAG: HAD-IA family hydrolase [Firmicutes bacterium]|nr:HAD-IA family hydrolase [Bacillota bacterium]